MAARGDVSHTYVAALQNDLEEFPNATHVGVVRRPTPWFYDVVDENVPALAPPDDLLDEFKDRCADLEMQGLCADGAHNAAWDELSFEQRYLDHLAASEDAAEQVQALLERLEQGEDLVLVCYENTDAKRCHRTILVDELTAGSS